MASTPTALHDDLATIVSTDYRTRMDPSAIVGPLRQLAGERG